MDRKRQGVSCWVLPGERGSFRNGVAPLGELGRFSLWDKGYFIKDLLHELIKDNKI